MILIIDDDSAVRSSLSFMLKRAGYEAQTVSGPREAMEVVRSVAPDLILMDMNFTLSTTGEEGLTLLRQVKIFRYSRNGSIVCPETIRKLSNGPSPLILILEK